MANVIHKGTQILYVPTHAKGDISHPDVQHGFVMEDRSDIDCCRCRYWIKGKEGKELRTKTNSELTPIPNIVQRSSTEHYVVSEFIRRIENELDGMC